MSAVPIPVAILLIELGRRGIELRAAGDRLRYRPRSAITPDLADQLAAHKGELLAILAAADALANPAPAGVASAPAATYTPEERRLLAGCSLRVLELVEAAKAAFAPGGVTVEGVRPFKSPARDPAARLIRDARRGGDGRRAVALRDAWRERLAICTIDGGVPLANAEMVALDELRTMDHPCHSARLVV